MCSDPVTFGGGKAMQYGSPGALGSAVKTLASAQPAKMRPSTSAAS